MTTTVRMFCVADVSGSNAGARTLLWSMPSHDCNQEQVYSLAEKRILKSKPAEHQSMGEKMGEIMSSQQHSRVFPGFDEVYIVTELSYLVFRADIDDVDISTLIALNQGKDATVRSLRAHYVMGRSKPADIVFTTQVFPLLFNERVRDLLISEGVSGWGSIPCTLHGKHGEEWQYNYLTVAGRCGEIDNSKSTKYFEQKPGGRFPAWKGLFFDEATWDGSDVFQPRGSANLFVVDRVRTLLERAKVKHVKFEALDEYKRTISL
jgi:hypothetical protein